MKKLIVGTLVGASLAAAAAPLLLAQSAASSTDKPQAERFAHRHGHGKRAFRMPSERIEARLAYLKTALKITDKQQAQWDRFAETLRQQARTDDDRIKALRAQREQGVKHVRPTAIERMERRQARLTAGAERLGQMLAAAKPLYAALSPDQQQIADELLAHRGHDTFRRHGWRRRS